MIKRTLGLSVRQTQPRKLRGVKNICKRVTNVWFKSFAPKKYYHVKLFCNHKNSYKPHDSSISIIKFHLYRNNVMHARY